MPLFVHISLCYYLPYWLYQGYHVPRMHRLLPGALVQMPCRVSPVAAILTMLADLARIIAVLMPVARVTAMQQLSVVNMLQKHPETVPSMSAAGMDVQFVPTLDCLLI